MRDEQPGEMSLTAAHSLIGRWSAAYAETIAGQSPFFGESPIFSRFFVGSIKMGLLDSIVGVVLAGNQPSQTEEGGGRASLLSSLISNPQLVQGLAELLSNDSAHGGLPGLIGRFQQAGLGGAIRSWIGAGENEPLSGDQLTQALGEETIGHLAQRLGLDTGSVAGQISHILPGLIDHLTPSGQSPETGLGKADDLLAALGGLLTQR